VCGISGDAYTAGFSASLHAAPVHTHIFNFTRNSLTAHPTFVLLRVINNLRLSQCVDNVNGVAKKAEKHQTPKYGAKL